MACGIKDLFCIFEIAIAGGDYYIMLQGSQNQPIRYEAIQNLTSPTIQAHARQDVGSAGTGVVYATSTRKQVACMVNN